MDIHEHQAKELLSENGVAIPRGALAATPEEAQAVAQAIGGERWMVKAQIHSGSRGKAGLIRLCRSVQEVAATSRELLGREVTTAQSGPESKSVGKVYIEEAADVAHEVYLAFMLNRSRECVTVMASARGGADIEESVSADGDALVEMDLESGTTLHAFQARALASALGVRGAEVHGAAKAILGCERVFRVYDLAMLEINPLACTAEGRVLALDAKISCDDNALFRQPRIAAMRDRSQENLRESHASDQGLSYVGLDGTIGCIINGAGLAMATMDMIRLSGGEAANFLDIGGGASPERVARAFELVLADSRVKAVLVNIFAGINRCDWIAEGVAQAMRAQQVQLPVILRLSGTHVEAGRKIVAASGLPIELADTLHDAARTAVSAANDPRQ